MGLVLLRVGSLLSAALLDVAAPGDDVDAYLLLSDLSDKEVSSRPDTLNALDEFAKARSINLSVSPV